MIRLSEVEFGFLPDGPPLFSGVDLRVGAGETVAVTGPSGVGKTSLLNLMAGLALPRRGGVWHGETCVSAMDQAARVRWRGRHLGFVYQGFHLLPFLSAAENVALPLALIGEQWEAQPVTTQLAALGVSHLADRYPGHLSGGEQQRVAIARALVHRPQLVLADEPTGNLDETTAATVLDLLIASVRERGASLVMVTHSERAAASVDRRLWLDGKGLHAGE